MMQSSILWISNIDSEAGADVIVLMTIGLQSQPSILLSKNMIFINIQVIREVNV